MRNVLSWNEALGQEFEPRLYPYAAGKVPLGRFDAKLDFKIWAKWTVGISCYFTDLVTGVKFQLTVFRNEKTKSYILKGSGVDFSTCDINCDYTIEVSVNASDRVIFIAAHLAGVNS
jgi:hypothetical protein